MPTLLRFLGVVMVSMGFAACANTQSNLARSPASSPPIWGGEEGSYPSSFMINGNGNFCGATRVSGRVFVTAAHCFCIDGEKKSNYSSNIASLAHPESRKNPMMLDVLHQTVWIQNEFSCGRPPEQDINLRTYQTQSFHRTDIALLVVSKADSDRMDTLYPNSKIALLAETPSRVGDTLSFVGFGMRGWRKNPLKMKDASRDFDAIWNFDYVPSIGKNTISRISDDQLVVESDIITDKSGNVTVQNSVTMWGDSGGGVFNEKGELVGVVSNGNSRTVSAFVPLLSKVNRDFFSPALKNLGLAWDPKETLP